MESLWRALSWLVVLAVGLVPVLVYWVAGMIGGALRSKRGGVRGRVAGHSKPLGRSETTGAMQLRLVRRPPMEF
jgi:hypothetical protein